jgi:hypothetical protein
MSIRSHCFKTISEISKDATNGCNFLLWAVQDTSISSKVASPNAPLGYGLCLLNLGLDGFTNASQDSLTARFSLSLSPNVYHCTRIISWKQKISVVSCELLSVATNMYLNAAAVPNSESWSYP